MSKEKGRVDRLGYASARHRLRKLKISSRRLIDSLFSGNSRSIFKGPGLDFHEVRQYVIGDDIRFIDWNVSSRLDQTYCKVFNEEREINLMFILDFSSSMISGLNVTKIRTVQELFAVLGFAALNNGDKVGSMAFGDDIKWFTAAKAGTKHFLGQLKRFLTSCEKTHLGGSNLGNALKVTAENMKRRGICIIVSDFKTDNYWRELSFLSRRHEVIAIRVEDPLDTEFPKVGHLSLHDAEEGDVTHFYPKSKKFQQSYHGYWDMLATNWRHNCHKRGVRTLVVSSGQDISKSLIGFLRKRKGA
ncbi:MAG: DUF58 domain-containing protein [Spirochaetia bacterium]